MLLISQKSWTKYLLSTAVGFSHRYNRGVIWTTAEDHETMSLVTFYYDVDALKVF